MHLIFLSFFERLIFQGSLKATEGREVLLMELQVTRLNMEDREKLLVKKDLQECPCTIKAHGYRPVLKNRGYHLLTDLRAKMSSDQPFESF